MDRRTRPEQEHLPLGRCRIKILGDLEPVRALLPIRFIPETTNSAGLAGLLARMVVPVPVMFTLHGWDPNAQAVRD